MSRTADADAEHPKKNIGLFWASSSKLADLRLLLCFAKMSLTFLHGTVQYTSGVAAASRLVESFRFHLFTGRADFL